MDFQVTYKLIYTTRTVTGKKVNIRDCIDRTHAKVKFKSFVATKYKNAVDVDIITITEINEDKGNDLMNDLLGGKFF